MTHIERYHYRAYQRDAEQGLHELHAVGCQQAHVVARPDALRNEAARDRHRAVKQLPEGGARIGKHECQVLRTAVRVLEQQVAER